jgi:LmbE family N-acetylglucosaminyl deacetylase
MDHTYGFHPVKRFVTPAPVPYIITEKKLPKNHRILAFLPHSDDGRYFGSTLHLMNKSNAVKIIILSPGYLGVDQDITIQEKIRVRWKEAQRWAEVLGFRKNQLINFRADQTYNTQQVNTAELDRLQNLIKKENPTMVFIPHLSDTAQAINYNTRAMVVKSLLWWIETAHKKDPRRFRPPVLIEYPTNHVPILPPSDKNFVIFFTDPEIPRLRREANLEHKSQISACFDMTEKLVEAVHAISEADTIHYLQKRSPFADCHSGIMVDPRTSRGEHFGVTKMSVKGDPPIIIEQRMEFPISGEDRKIWNRKPDEDNGFVIRSR